MLKPVLFGYLDATRYPARKPSASADRVAMTRFAIREGFSLAQVFVERDVTGCRPALTSLIEAGLFAEVSGVLVPDMTHLDRDISNQSAIRRRIESTLTAPVIAMRLT